MKERYILKRRDSSKGHKSKLKEVGFNLCVSIFLATYSKENIPGQYCHTFLVLLHGLVGGLVSPVV